MESLSCLVIRPEESRLPMKSCLILASLLLFAVSTTFANAEDIPPVAGRTLTAWQADLDSSNRTVRLRAAKTIGIFGEPAVTPITKMLGHTDPAIRYWAASHLGNIGGAASPSSDALRAHMNDESTGVRMAVAYALCCIEDPQQWSGPLLKGVNSKQRGTACAAADFLGRIGPRAKSLLPAIEATHKRHAQGGDYHVRGAMKNAIRLIKNDGVLENHTRPKGGGPPRGWQKGRLTEGPAPRSKKVAQQRPNILWISCEDISVNLGCYGDDYASTPNLDRLASEGTRFTRAFTPTGVCAINRTGIITGMYPIAYGGHHMRTNVPFPKGVKCFPEYLRAAGYFCTNKSKTDYQSNQNLKAVWDRQGARHTDWRERKPGQPFFSVINLTICHESQIRHGEKTHAALLERLEPEQRHDPDQAGKYLPPIYPNTPEVRKDWAWYQDNISEMDRQAGEILQRLDEDGLRENTVVIFWSDHGRGLPRGKRWIYDSGVHVPVIVRWPGRMKPGTLNGELVSTEDLAPTTLSLAGITPKDYMHGRVFLGEHKRPAPEMLFFHRDRMDEAYELMRGARDHEFKYIRNFEPERTYAQHIDYMDMMPTLVDMRRLHAEGSLNPVQQLWFRDRKPVEELYDIVNDPHETVNLAAEPQYGDRLSRMRSAVEAWQDKIGDMGLISEPIMMDELSQLRR